MEKIYFGNIKTFRGGFLLIGKLLVIYLRFIGRYKICKIILLTCRYKYINLFCITVCRYAFDSCSLCMLKCVIPSPLSFPL